MPAEEVRLQKVLAQAGVASRRAAEELIRQGRVTVNGQVVTNLGTKVVPESDRVAVDGVDISGPEQLVYWAVNKPKGYLSSARDTHGRPTVLDLLPGGGRVYPVGRLDLDTEGLLLVTNDGELAHRVIHPRHQLDKEYQVQVRGHPSAPALEHLRSGIDLDGRPTAPAKVEVERRTADSTWLRVVLREGRKRQVRRMFAAIGHQVTHLRRVRVGPVTLGDLPPGAHRSLTADEVAKLRKNASETDHSD